MKFPALHPGLEHLPPERGGLTYRQWQAYADAMRDDPWPIPTWTCERPG